MNTIKNLICWFALIALLTGCAPVMVASHYYRSGKESELIKEFTDSIRATNIEREKAGLKPLDICEEIKTQSERLREQFEDNCTN
jgi:hypothetical protein